MKSTNPVLLIGVLVVSAMMMIFNETTVAVALPAIMADFGVPADTAQWLMTGFLLTMSVAIPASGFVIQRLSTRAVYFASMALFIVGCVMAATAPSFGVLLAARVVQALGTAAMLPLLMTVTVTVVAPQRRGTVMGLNAVVMSVAPALGPTLAGFVLGAFTWHHIFWVMVPIPAAAVLLAVFALPNVGERHDAPLDILSVLLSAVAFGGLVYGLSTITALLTGESWNPLVALVIGAVFLVLFVRRQLRLAPTGRALLDLRVFTHRNFAFSVVGVFIAFGILLGTVNILPVYMQVGLGISTVATGLILLPGGIAQGVASPIAGRCYDAYGPRPLTIPGAVLMLASQWILVAILADDTPQWQLVAVLILVNVAMSMIMTPLMTVSLSSLPSQLYAHGSAALNTLQQLGGAAGTAVFIATMTMGTQATGSASDGTARAFVVGGVGMLLVVVAVCFVGGKPNTRLIDHG
ncbi:DHA2 family efflux MFS transporter permease subunit [Corynebacterium sp. UMB10321]|uniref:DHA2 family efflux MFS transporter permease subunit n=1 Tax=Corynebacterium sp. UMB10321 TaxID=3046312 RepID=UPI00254B2F7C|nr:DHA2 family efflux MFS transporter permease subunit [Corynebacterium sp. UMB10321]MDK8244648.1 DHA2 family efflux MFS transporter permease subunit [Corynebacterium sp. UMB10321]